MMPSPRHMILEPRNDTPAEQEYGWLERWRLQLRGVIHELSVGYPLLSTPDQIDRAISDLESAADNISRRMRDLDTNGSGA